MIDKISIKNVASYGDCQQDFEPLERVNFLYGSNGTGKTTISKLIADPDGEGFEDCDVVWENGVKLDTRVYNRDFVENNFDAPPELEGIFTLGEESKKKRQEIDSKRNTLAQIEHRITRRNARLEGRESKLRDLDATFSKTCWTTLKLRFQSKFKKAFKGSMGSMVNFRNRLLRESRAAHPVPTKDQNDNLKELESRANTLFGDTQTREELISLPDATPILSHETNPILLKKVIGKSDVDIAALINKLGNSDWVKRGREFYDPSSEDRICPFCQQETPRSLETSLNDYFDEAFQADSANIEKLYHDYISDAQRMRDDLDKILQEAPDQLDTNVFQVLCDNFVSKSTSNLQRIEQKRREPSRLVKLDSLEDTFTDITTLLAGANSQITSHNEMVANIDVEKKRLTDQVWSHLLEYEIKGPLHSYNKAKKDLTTAIENIKRQNKESDKRKRKVRSEISALERSTTSIKPTIDAINQSLTQFGFQGFSLAQAREGSNFYTIRRPDGSDAKQTLSEGERSFIAFLYFYHLLRGSTSGDRVTTDRIVVFDDPVSSLDSQVLFVVSCIIREICQGFVSTVKQVFVFTHNVYFHKEVTYNSHNNPGVETFWIVRKPERRSKIKWYPTNPINTTYELLWMEVYESDENTVSIPNTLRRILEYYFRILGGDVNWDETCSKFQGLEKSICRSLFLWVDAGSHAVFEEIDFSPDPDMLEKYKAVFKKIFEIKHQLDHYEMMMQGAKKAVEARLEAMASRANQ